MFTNDAGAIVTVNGGPHHIMINDCIFENMDDIDPVKMWLEWNGATSHTRNATIDLLQFIFGNKINI